MIESTHEIRSAIAKGKSLRRVYIMASLMISRWRLKSYNNSKYCRQPLD